MATCTYTFTGADGKSIDIKGIPALKEFLLEGGLDTYLPARAIELAEAGGEAPALSRREQKNAAASRVSNVSSDRFKRTDELQQAVTDLQEGKITQDEYNAMVDELRPVYPYEKVPALTTPADAKYALANGRGQSPEKAAKYGLPSDTLAKGDFAQLRLDIPSYQEHDSWVVSVHTPKSTNREVQAAYDAGTVIGYESVAAMTDVTFGMNQKAATKIAQGTSKGTIATMLGKWKPISNQAAKVRADAAIKDPAWTQVGMDPFRHSYFYDRDTMRPVLSADEVIQIGPLVLAKNATFSEDGTDITGAPIAFSSRQTDTPQLKKWFGDSKVVDENGNPMIVYHGTNEDFVEFNPYADKKTQGGESLRGTNAMFFTNSPELASAYTGVAKSILTGDFFAYPRESAYGGNVMPVYLSMQNPMIVDAEGQLYNKVEPLIRKAKKNGHDGVIFRNVRDQPGAAGDLQTLAHDAYVVFKPNQIKSATGNRGTFDETNPDIRYSARENINSRLEQKIFSDFDAAVEEYSAIKETKKGRLLDTDLARLLSPEYRADRNRAPEVHEAASAFTQRLFEKRMQEMRERPGGLVLFMAGGGGSGKSSAETLLDDVFNRANTIVDGTLSGYEKAMRNIQLALDSGQAVMIAYVYREPVDSLVGGVFKRAMDPTNGRTVVLDALVKGHAGSNETVLKLQKDFADNPLFDVVAVDNSRGNGNFAVVPLEEIPVVNKEGLREKLQNATDKELEAGRINQAVYNATTRGFNTGPEGRSTSQTIGDQTRAVGEGRGRGQFEGPSYSVRQAAQGQRFTLRDETYTGAVQRNLQDYFARVKDVQDALAAQGGTVTEAQNVYLAEELSYGRLQEQMIDFKEDMLKPLLKATKAAGLELSDLALYAYAKHAPERNQAIAARNKTFGKGEGSGMTTSEANNIMRAFKAEGKDADLATLHAQLMQITQATRRVLLSEGLITQDQFDALQTQYADYVPLRGFVEDEDPESGRAVSGPRVGGKGFNIRGKETMRALGRESRAGHVIENIVIDYERAVARAERNAVAKVFLDLATTNPDPGLWEIDAERTKAAFDRATGQVKYNTLIDKGEDTISVKIDGNEVYVKVKDPLLLRALRNSAKDETGAIDRVLAMSLGNLTALMRNTLTRYNPAFGFTNAVKDLGFGAVSALSDLGPKGTALYLKNYANPRQSGPLFEEFRAAGATTGGWHIRDQQEMQKELQRLIEWEGGSSLKSSAYSMARGTLDALEFIGQYSETQARFAAYKAARELGRSPADAASVAKNLTTNFNRKGEWGSAMNTLYLFFNAGVQGSVKTVKNLRSPYVMAAMAGLTGLSAGLAFMGAGVGGDDDDGEAYWDKIPQFEKERNLIIMLPPGEGMLIKGINKVGKNGRYLKLPIQYGLNVFSTFGYQMADLARYSQDHSRGVSPAKAAVNMVSVTFGSFNPFGGGFDLTKPTEVALAVSPTVVDLGVQALMGVNSFGTPVAPRKYDDYKPDAENFGPGMAGTWEQRLARWLSESTGGDRAVGGAIDVSPGSIRNIVRNLTGGTGDFLASVFVNIPSKMWSPDGEVGPRDVPVLKAFYGEVDDATDSRLFYERKAEVMEAAKQASDRQKLGIEVTYDAKSQGLQSLGNAAKSFTKKMTQLRKEELRVAEDADLTDAQRDAERKRIQKDRAEIASDFNAAYYDMKKGVAKEERQKEALAAGRK